MNAAEMQFPEFPPVLEAQPQLQIPRLQILYVHKPEARTSQHEHIERVGGRNPDGSLWAMSQEEAIREIEDGDMELFVHAGGEVVPVIVSTSKWGHKYLRTVKAEIVPDNLLSLPDFP